MELIRHQAVITKVEKLKITARVQVRSACGSCAARGACGLGDCADKIIEISHDNAGSYRPGDRITVSLRQDSGFLALFLGYIAPLILVLTVLFSCLYGGLGEISSGIYSIIVLIPYYFGLSLARKHLQKKFYFSIVDE